MTPNTTSFSTSPERSSTQALLDDVVNGISVTHTSPFKGPYRLIIYTLMHLWLNVYSLGRLGYLRTRNRDTERTRDLGPVVDVVEHAAYHRFNGIAAMNKHDVSQVATEFELDIHYKSVRTCLPSCLLRV